MQPTPKPPQNIQPATQPPAAAPKTPPAATEKPKGSSKPSVLIVHPDSRTLRLIRESLEGFKDCNFVTTPDAEYGFELALKKNHDLYIFGLNLPVLHGELLYSLISRAYTFSHQGALTAPAVIYIGDAQDASKAAELKQDARVRGVMFRPFKIDRFLNAIGDLIPNKT